MEYKVIFGEFTSSYQYAHYTCGVASAMASPEINDDSLEKVDGILRFVDEGSIDEVRILIAELIEHSVEVAQEYGTVEVREKFDDFIEEYRDIILLQGR